MKKLKIYLDTSVISHVQAEDAAEKATSTLRLWEEMIQDKYDICISKLVLAELNKCSEPKRTLMFHYLNRLKTEILEIDEVIELLALKYIEENIIPEKYGDDATHISAATVNNCDYIISWNFNHMVKVKTIMGVNGINKLMRYKEIGIVSPDSLIEEGDDD
jgi:predicted nucleic acid-binding protein